MTRWRIRCHSRDVPYLSPFKKMDQQFQTSSNAAVKPDSKKSEWRTILEGLGFFALGFVGFLASFWFAGKAKSVVGIATLFGAGMFGYGAFRLVFGDRWPLFAWITAVVSALVGLGLTLAALFLLLGEGFM